MAKNIQINYNDGTSYEVLYPQTLASQVQAGTFSGSFTFSSVPSCGVTPTSASHLTRKGYVDSLIAGLDTGGMSITRGTYTGTGSYSQSPEVNIGGELVWFLATSSSASSSCLYLSYNSNLPSANNVFCSDSIFIINNSGEDGIMYGPTLGYASSSTYAYCPTLVTKSGNTISWTPASTVLPTSATDDTRARAMANRSGKTYTWVACVA